MIEVIAWRLADMCGPVGCAVVCAWPGAVLCRVVAHEFGLSIAEVIAKLGAGSTMGHV